jgi:IMP dehydrogenase
MRILAEALTYDDVYLVPGHSIVLPRDVDTSTRLHPQPAPEHPDRVRRHGHGDRSRLAITMAQNGGIGIIHKNMTGRAAGGGSSAGEEVRGGRDPPPDHRQPGHVDREVLR